MSNQSIIEHKANMFYVEFREDYLAICLQCTYRKPVKGKEKSKASPYCKALILAISESWTNEKRGKGTELSFYMTYPQWIESMYGMFGRNVVIDSVDELIGEALLSREPVKYKGKDTFRYTLNHAEINRRMKDLPERTPYNTHPQVNALISKRDDKSTGLQVNGKAFTNQPDTRLQVNDDPFTKGRNIESTNTPYIDSAQNTEEEGTLRDDHADTGSLHSPTPALSPIATDTPTTEDEMISPPEPTPSEDKAGSAGYEKNGKRTGESIPAQQLSTRVPQSGKVSHARTEGRKKKTEEPEPITLSHDAEKIWRAWCSLFTVEVELIPSNAAAAEKLVKPARAWCSKLHWTLAEWLKSVKDNAYEADSKGYYRKRGVKLFDIPRELEGWQSAKEHELSALAQAAAPKPTTPPPVNPTLEALRQQRLHYTGVMS